MHFFPFKKDTPHWELLFRMVLNQKTSASGQVNLCQKNESIDTVNRINASAVGITSFKHLKNENFSHEHFS